MATARAPPAWILADMASLPPLIDFAACGAGVRVSADGRTATSASGFDTAGSRVALMCGRKRVRGRLRVEFRVDGVSANVFFGYALLGGACAHGALAVDAGTQRAVDNFCYERGARVEGAPFRVIGVGHAAALLFDADAGTLGYEVDGAFVGTLFRGLAGLSVVPAFFVHLGAPYVGGPRLTITRVHSGAGAWRLRRVSRAAPRGRWDLM